MYDTLKLDMIFQVEDSKLKEKIIQISNQFIQESVQSPTLLADMASMEKYMTESYNGRIFIELLQNADDSQSTKVIVKQSGNNLYFANNGRSFDEADIVAICRSGASSKQRGINIGYRGVGFKSSTYLSEEILIYSAGACFTFSKKHCADVLNIQKEHIPTVRIPFYVDTLEDSCTEEILRLKQQGYQTVFVFKNAHLEEFHSELEKIEDGLFIFLNYVAECSIITDYHNRSLRFKRIRHNSGYDFMNITDSLYSWRIFKYDYSSIAVKLKNGRMVSADSEESIYHSYLPTQEKAPYKIKINNDFSTDPSRKRLTIDEFTKTALKLTAIHILNLIQSVFRGEVLENAAQLLLIFNEQVSFSQSNSILIAYLKDGFTNMQLKMADGSMIPASEYKLFPNWLDAAEIDIIRKFSPFLNKYSLPHVIYDNYMGVDQFILNYSEKTFSTEDMIEIVSDKILCEKLSVETHGKIIANIVKQAKIRYQISKENLDIGKVLIYIIDETVRKTNTELCTVIENELTSSDWDWLSSTTGVRLQPKKSTRSSLIFVNSAPTQSKKPTVTKWRSAEQQIIQIEEFLGNKAINVSKKNVGYDIESITPSGVKRYIEVKSLQNDYSGFCITNNEYTAAHQYGDEYFICLMFENRVIYIQNPLKNLSFEKRIRQWEWLCEQYSGEEIELNVN